MSLPSVRLTLVWSLSAVLIAAMPAPGEAQTLTDRDRTEIRALSDRYVAALDNCKAGPYADLFTPDGMFISGPRGHVMGHEALMGLVTSERYCQPGAAGRNGASHEFTKVVIEPSATGATGLVYLPGREPGSSGGHYEDVYVKTSAGWRFKSRTYLSPKEEAAASKP